MFLSWPVVGTVKIPICSVLVHQIILYEDIYHTKKRIDDPHLWSSFLFPLQRES